jgi:hypothetical protein
VQDVTELGLGFRVSTELRDNNNRRKPQKDNLPPLGLLSCSLVSLHCAVDRIPDQPADCCRNCSWVWYTGDAPACTRIRMPPPSYCCRDGVVPVLLGNWTSLANEHILHDGKTFATDKFRSHGSTERWVWRCTRSRV